MKYARWLRQKRKEKKMTQAEVAKALGVSRETISSWERQRCRPTLEFTEQIFQLYECSDEDILSFFS